MTIKTYCVMDDPYMTLQDFKEHVDNWISIYGPEAIVYTDAGYNNVSVLIEEKV
jgi:hypothetical protein